MFVAVARLEKLVLGSHWIVAVVFQALPLVGLDMELLERDGASPQEMLESAPCLKGSQ